MLKGILPDVFERGEQVQVTAEKMQLWRHVSGDDGAIHFDPKVAAAAGYAGTPAYGSFLVASSERFLNRLLAKLHLNGNSGYRVTQQSIGIPNPAYPGDGSFPDDRVRFVYDEDSIQETSAGECQFAFRCIKEQARANEGLEVLVSEAKLTRNLYPLEGHRNQVLYSKAFPVREETLSLYDKVVPLSGGGIPQALLVCGIISAALDLSKYDGVLAKIDIFPYRAPTLGIFMTRLSIDKKTELDERLRKRIRVDKKYSYVIRADCVDEQHQPLTLGVIKCLTDVDFDVAQTSL